MLIRAFQIQVGREVQLRRLCSTARQELPDSNQTSKMSFSFRSVAG